MFNEHQNNIYQCHVFCNNITILSASFLNCGAQGTGQEVHLGQDVGVTKHHEKRILATAEINSLNGWCKSC